MTRIWQRDPARVFLAALGLRALFAWETRSDPLFSILAVDARSYFELAGRFASGDWLYGHDPLWFAPLYPTLLGVLFRVLGPDPVWAKLLQFALGAGAAALVTGIGARISRGAGLTAGAILAVYPVALFYEGQLLYTSLAVFLTALALARLLAALDAPAGRGAFAAGIVLGLLGLVRSNSLLFLPVGALLLWRRRGRRAAAVYAGAGLLCLAPVLLRNGLVAGSWTPMTVNGGMIFATGFAEESLGGRALQRRPEDFGPHGAFHREAERATGRAMTLAEASRFHRDRTLRRIAEDPGSALRLTLKKLELLVNVREIDDNLGFTLVKNRARLLSWLPGPWAWMAIPAVFTVVARLRGRKPADRVVKVLTLYAAVYCVSLLMFFMNSRYRLPLIVPGSVLAGAALVWVVEAVRARAWRRLVVPAGVAVVATFLVLRAPGVRADPALQLTAVGAALEREGRHEDALRITDRALAMDPGVAGAHQNRALALLGLGRTAEALRAAEEATRLDPDLAAAWTTQGAIHARAGRVDEALPSFRRAAELTPDDPVVLENLAQALAVTGRMAEAVEVGRRAVAAGAKRLAPRLAEWERSYK